VIRCRLALLAAILASALLAAACGGSDSGGPCSGEECLSDLEDQLDDIDWDSKPVEGKDPVTIPEGDLAETLPSIAEFPIVVRAPGGTTSVEIFTSTEKSGEDTDGWMVEVANAFNAERLTLSDGSTAAVEIRRIASGTGYQFIKARSHLPDAYSPSNQLWVEMAGTHVDVTEISSRLVPNVAGIVMRDETAERLRASKPELDPAALVDAVIAGDIVMGYTDPFASSTALNFLLTVLDEIADGDQARLTAPDVVSVFEEFQRQVPYVALTTLQIRDSVEKENGQLDAFVMEWQTFTNTDQLSSGYEFIPFGVNHDNPLYAIGDLPAEKLEALERFAEFATNAENQNRAAALGFDPPAYTSGLNVPSGETLIDAQQTWKDKKDGGRRVAAVFVVDVSGSMLGTRVAALRTAMLSAQEFITPENAVGVVEFNDTARERIPVDEFDLNQRGAFAYLANRLEPYGGTAMYDGIVVGLKMLIDDRDAHPDTKSILIVLSDGQPTEGKTFGDVEGLIEGLGIPIYTVGFEADVDELRRVSSLVEAASIDASEADVEFKISALFNATV
jgi:Ca-activated chloride channel family protein